MRRIRLIVEYDGTPFHGWQRQKDVPSIQQEIEEACARFTHHPVTLHCAGRTDAGVHARGQVAHFDTPVTLSTHTIQSALNYYLAKKGIVILKACDMDDNFHARFGAKKRIYEYHILARRSPAALEAGRIWHVPKPLDMDAIEQARRKLLGTHDFSSFRDTDCQAKSPVRTLDRLDMTQDDERIIFTVEALSFLHHQVRIMVGTLVDIGKGKRQAQEITAMLATRHRTAAGVTAPACGLYFMAVEY